jgi:hypothetical protein
MRKLSVLCATRDPGERVRAILAAFAPVAHEIVVAADSRVCEADLAHYAQVADRLLRFEHAGPDRSLAFLHAQCTGEWILMVAGDEAPSPRLLSRLAELPDQGDVQQYLIPMRWLYPDAGHWLEELPWCPDYHNRLVRNDASLWFPGNIHSGAALAHPARYLEEPLYHLDCALTSLDAREQKVARYEDVAPGLLAPGGGALNERYFLPERHARLQPSLVPAEDRKTIEAVMRASWPRRTASADRDIPLTTRAQVLSHWAGRELPEDAYQARLTPLERDLRAEAGERRAIHVRVTNAGNDRWPWATPAHAPVIRLSYRWWTEDGRCIGEGERTSLPHPLGPGESCVAPVTVSAPKLAGRYVLELDLVHEHVRWFGSELRLAYEITESSKQQAEPAPTRRG